VEVEAKMRVLEVEAKVVEAKEVEAQEVKVAVKAVAVKAVATMEVAGNAWRAICWPWWPGTSSSPS